jgi:chromosome segregation ATPase
MLESERFRVRDKVIDTDCLKEQFQVDKQQIEYEMEMRQRDIDAIEKEFHEAAARIKAFQSEVDDLRSLCMTLQDKICGNRHDLHFSNGGKTSLKD